MMNAGLVSTPGQLCDLGKPVPHSAPQFLLFSFLYVIT